MDEPTPWLSLLAMARPHLKGRDVRGRIGSLRWLENRMVEMGGRRGAVRNILYKNLGSAEEKARLFTILRELYDKAGLAPPTPPEGLYSRRLGRDKRTVLRRLIKDPKAQLVVVGSPATGKRVLLDEADRIWPGALRLNLEGELAGPLFMLAEELGCASRIEALFARLSHQLPYAALGDLQAQILETLVAALNHARRPLLLRTGEDAQCSGIPLYTETGERTDPSGFARELIAGLRIPYLAALSQGEGDYKLRPPTQREARHYVMEKLPFLSLEEADALVRRAGTDYQHLSQLIALRALELGQEARLGPRLEKLLTALTVLAPREDPEIPKDLLETVLGHPLDTLAPTIWALIEVGGEGRLRPIKSGLFSPKPEDAMEVHRKALAFFAKGPPFRQLHHALGAGEWDIAIEVLEDDPGRVALIPDLWDRSKIWPRESRLRLARVVVRYRALRGQFDHPERNEALALLKESEKQVDRDWARLKEAEHALDMGQAEHALTLAPDPKGLSGAERVEAALVQAALARWQGNYPLARHWVKVAAQENVPDYMKDRVHLWLGVVEKDAGAHREASAALERVKAPLLQKARAEYQLGDLHMRLGRLEKASELLQRAASILESEGTPSEAAMAWARVGGVARRCGKYSEAELAFNKARSLAPEGLPWARVRSEEGIFLAAAGRLNEAAYALLEAEEALAVSHHRPQERAYRLLRTHLRMASVLFAREQMRPFRPPFVPIKAPGVRALLQTIEAKLPALADTSERWRSLAFDLAMLKALSSGSVIERLQQREEHPVREVERRLLLATLALHQGEPDKALSLVYGLGVPGEPGLMAWLRYIEITARPEAALGELDLPMPFLQSLGEALFLSMDAETLARRLGRPARSDLPEAWGRLLTKRAGEGMVSTSQHAVKEEK